jgi:hypothetical protein
MRRFSLVSAALCLAAVVVPGSAAATTVELGYTTASPVVAPACSTKLPLADCKIILERASALETIRAGIDYPTTAKQSGYIVAFTLGLSRLSTNLTMAHSIIANEDRAYGGTTRASVAVLKPVGKHGKFTWELTAISPVVHLQPYLGTVAQFPLQTALPIAKGEVVALSVPTWAPVLSIDLNPKEYAYRQSRNTLCSNTAGSETAMFSLSTTSVFGCDYTGVRVEYSATEITSPVPPKSEIHGGRRQAPRRAG